MAMSELGIYVYGVVSDGALVSVPEVRGVDRDRAVELVEHGEIGALISRVGLDQFGDDTLRTHLSDMGWVEATARGHQRVLDDVIDQCTPIPMRLCTIYRDESGLRTMLEREHDILASALCELDSKLEWGVKGFEQRGESAEPDPSAVPTPRPATGTAYLQQRLASRSAGAQRQTDLGQSCAAAHQEFAALATACRLNALQRPEVSGRDTAMLINASYLVANQRRDRFCRLFTAVRNEVAEHGLALELTGPWPPYNFVPTAIGGGL